MAVDVIEKVIDAQKQSDLKFLELEEEDEMLDQDKRRKDQREFYVQMLTIMCTVTCNDLTSTILAMKYDLHYMKLKHIM